MMVLVIVVVKIKIGGGGGCGSNGFSKSGSKWQVQFSQNINVDDSLQQSLPS